MFVYILIGALIVPLNELCKWIIYEWERLHLYHGHICTSEQFGNTTYEFVAVILIRVMFTG